MIYRRALSSSNNQFLPNKTRKVIVMVRILIADDNSLMRKVLYTIMSEEGHEIVAEAEDGQDAVEKYFTIKPDIAMLDIIMPRMDGMMALRTILKGDPNARVLIITAVQSTEMVKLAFKIGAKGYIMKPFQRPILISEIQRVMNI